MKTTYENEAKNLAQAIDIAIKSIKKYPPENFQTHQINHFINTYLDIKNKALNPEPQFKKLSSLKYLIKDTLIFFQESSGKNVNYFWIEIENKKLPYKRENKVLNILKKNKIKNKLEYDYVIDTIIPFKQKGLISTEQSNQLKQLIAEFESK